MFRRRHLAVIALHRRTGLNGDRTSLGSWLERHQAVAVRAAAEHMKNNIKRVTNRDTINLKAVAMEAGRAAAVADAATAATDAAEELRAEPRQGAD
jgi:hypothetical protein